MEISGVRDTRSDIVPRLQQLRCRCCLRVIHMPAQANGRTLPFEREVCRVPRPVSGRAKPVVYFTHTFIPLLKTQLVF